MRKIAPSILAADFLNLGKDVEFVNGNADIFHLDVMDGTFVPNLSFGFPVIEAIASKATKPLDVHLMIVHPEKYIDRFAKVGASMISFHLEAAMRDGSNPNKIIDQIHFYPPIKHAMVASMCGRACDTACYVHLEEKGVLKRKFRTPFRKRPVWSLSLED